MGSAASNSYAKTGCGDDTSLLQVVSGKAQGTLGQLTDGAGMGSEDGRSAMLQYGDQLLHLMTNKYGNASSNIEGGDKELLRDIIGIINGAMYTSLQQDHGEDQNETNSDHQAVVDCNDNLVLEQAGTISTKRSSTEEARVAHKVCREGAQGGGLLQIVKSTSSDQRSLQLSHGSQDEACQLAHDKWVVLNNTIHGLTEPPDVPAFPNPRTLEAVTEFFEANVYVTWFLTSNFTFSQAKEEHDAAQEVCDSFKKQCDVLQHAFEEKYDLFRQYLTDACDRYDDCFLSKSNEYVDGKERLTASMKNRKAAFEAGETIIYKIECLLGDHGCEGPPIVSSQYNLTFTDLPSEQTCNASEVEHLSCSVEFRDAEYANLEVTTGVSCQD